MASYFQNISEPNLKLGDIYNTLSITPNQMLEIMKWDTFEELSELWVTVCSNVKYKNIKRFAGTGDKGRDVVGFYEDNTVDIYQCKHYKGLINFSTLKAELLKICYFIYKGDIPKLKNYYIVSPFGCSTTLHDNYLKKPDLIREGLKKYIKEPKTKVDNKLTSEMTDLPSFLAFVDSFNFSNIEEIQPQRLIDDMLETKYAPYYFGPSFFKIDFVPQMPPKEFLKDEQIYLSQLLKVYSEKKNKNFTSLKELDPQLTRHLNLQREYFFNIQSLIDTLRDSMINTDSIDLLEKICCQGLSEIINDLDYDGFQKLKESLNLVVKMDFSPSELKNLLYPNSKKGLCHRLVNKERICWIDEL
ncbi:ABC-three component system protein [Clostridium baratii]|uniref:ABC-three component systems C-terminal domain-containing protein n=1 Tax=Clostridium baratii TaxID=1561 RepID=A0A174QJT8_9CLOT|nr:ABC-three component system protein [Clostridium baratii]CUP73473.1 Uncharacterised protein [Clostridium baratii]